MQEETRKKREAAKKKEIEESDAKRNLAVNSVAAQAQVAKETERSMKLAVKKFHQPGAPAAKKRKTGSDETAPPSSGSCQKKKAKVRKAKPARKDATPQGERKLPKASDTHGCGHSGLLELLPLERKYLQTHVKAGGWLHETPCTDCAKNEGGGNNRVLDVSVLLNLKGRADSELGVCCNCGPVGHRMVEEEEPVRKQLWACNLVLCKGCFDRRKIGMGDTTDGGGKRTRRKKQLENC